MNETQKTIMNPICFPACFDDLDDPSRLAIETTDGQHISYGELISRAGQMANVLVSRASSPATALPRRPKVCSGSGSVSRHGAGGAVYLPLNTAYT